MPLVLSIRVTKRCDSKKMVFLPEQIDLIDMMISNDFNRPFHSSSLSHSVQIELKDRLFDDLSSLAGSFPDRESLNRQESIVHVFNWVKEFEKKNQALLEKSQQGQRPCQVGFKRTKNCHSSSFSKKSRRSSDSLDALKEQKENERKVNILWKERVLSLIEKDWECQQTHRDIISSPCLKDCMMSALEIMACINRNGLNWNERKRKREKMILISSSKELPIRLLRKVLECAKENLAAVDEICNCLDPKYSENVLNRKYDRCLHWHKWTNKREKLQRVVADFNQKSPFAFDRLFQGERWETDAQETTTWLEVVAEWLMINKI